jgi:hypothetical protein
MVNIDVIDRASGIPLVAVMMRSSDARGVAGGSFYTG